jgi:hypothetical protein
LGKEEVHYADDADVVDQKDVDELNANMSLLLNSKIVETLSYKHDVLKQFKYQFFDKNSKQSEFSNGGFSLGKRDKVINEYSPWRKEPGIL